ncbi:MAG: DEAD/DEAH box helicase [Treponema sp.]|nr:DEAD/DEAH box helicase [Treponema sp.]
MDTEELKEETQTGITMSEETPVDVDGAEDAVTFEDLGLDEYTLKAVEKKGFVTPSPIQVLAIPRLLNGDTNLIARARTGTGKTAAFGLPIIQNVRNKSDYVEALILEPTRELAMQTNTEMQSFANNDFPRTTVLYGGASYAQQIRELKQGCEIVVGTPGRIKDHLERKTLDLSKIKYFILDEGDEMLDMGFIDDIREIFEKSNAEARILLFSATMPAPILKIAADFMGEYDIVEEEKVVDEALLIDQKFWYVKESDKVEALVRLIDMSPDFYGIVFTMTKNDADRVTRELDMRGYEADALHGDIMQNQREKVIERFRLKKTRILVATDVAARGIDISGLSHVVNFSLPFDTATYVHRIGRTGRAGTTGTAVTFIRPEERRKSGYFTKNVERATKGKLVEEKIPNVNEVLTIKENRLIDELKLKLFFEEKAEDQTEEIVVEEAAENVITENVTAENDTALTENSEIAASENNLEEDSVENNTPVLRPYADKYGDLAAKLCEGQDAEQVLAAVLSVMYGEKLSPKHYGRISTKDMGPRGDQQRIFVSLGKKDGYRAKEIADFFSVLLHIPGRMVDDIDVAQQFSLVSLPVASAKKAIELSKNNKKLPHMHLDVKEEGRGSRKSRGEGRRRDDFEGEKRGGRSGNSERRNFDRGDSRSREGKEDRRREGRTKGDRPNVHTQSERNSSRKTGKTGGAAAFVKKGAKKAERF